MMFATSALVDNFSMYFFLIILGLVVGSFLGMLTYRLPRGISIMGRSFCDSCKGLVSWKQNVPLLYFLLSGGKCKTCGEKISLRYPIIELATVIVFILTMLLWQTTDTAVVSLMKDDFGPLSLLPVLALTTAALGLVIVDFEHSILPDSLTATLLGIVLLVLLFLPPPALIVNLFWGLLSFSVFLLIYLVTNGRGMGFGDVKLAFVVGSLLGFPGSIVWFMLSFTGGSLGGIALLLLGKAKLRQEIAFGPYLLFAFWITLFLGDKIWRWYLGWV